MVAKKFKFTVLRLLENTVVIKKNDSAYSCPQAKLSLPGFYYHYSRQKEITYFPQTKCFENQFFPSRERDNYGAENMIKLN